MNVFVESNFILELAFQQQEYVSCEKLLLAAESGQLTLFVPDYCLTEVFQTLGQRRMRRTETERFLQDEIRQHLREQGAVSRDMETLSQLVRELLLSRTQSQTARLFHVTQRISHIARLLPLNSQVLAAAQSVQERHRLTPQDALVYASVSQNLPGTTSSLFISRNEDDFQKPVLLRELQEKNCIYLSNFSAAVGRLRLG